ncbi:Cyclic nucleotide-binding domain protein [Candidatus Magnetomorum sp. HK-1]|nr:Cyclic nucleotide-binding domain protein [Candidatus Magnetomorum sp. HK-1]
MSFSDEIKKDLSLKMHQKKYQPKEVIIQQSDPGESLFIIVEGKPNKGRDIACNVSTVVLVSN